MFLATQGGEDALDPTVETVQSLYQRFWANLPIIGIALGLAVPGIVVASSVAGGVRRALERTKADPAAIDISVRILRIQAILENFIAGIILLLRRLFRAGDQIRTGDFEGTVQDGAALLQPAGQHQ